MEVDRKAGLAWGVILILAGLAFLVSRPEASLSRR